MPTFNHPRQAIIVEGSGIGDLLGPLVLLGAVAVAIGAVVLFIAAHLVLISAGLAAVAAGTIAAVRYLRRFMVLAHEEAPKPALPLSVQAELLVPRHRAIAPVHNHLHFHGLSADDIATAVSQVANVPPDAVRTSLHTLPEASDRRSR